MEKIIKIEEDIEKPAKRLKRSSENDDNEFIAEQGEKDSNEQLKQDNIVQGKKEKATGSKIFEAQKRCRCAKKCALKIDIDLQKKLYNGFQSLNWSEQTLQIRSSVKRIPVSTSITAHNPIICLKERKYNFLYSLIDANGTEQEVCRSFFTKCLKITASRVNFAMSSSDKNPNAIDTRGRRQAHNKTPEDMTNKVKNFIELFPRYEKNYKKNGRYKKFLHPELNLKKLYDEYKATFEAKNEKIVSSSVFRLVFEGSFNLSFKHRYSALCKTCQHYNGILQTVILGNEKVEIESQKAKHLEYVEKINTEFRNDVEMATENSQKSSLVLTFDLQQALETPYLSSSAGYYKRQFWTHNLCIFDEAEKQSYMYVWNESIASRRGREIGSCLLYHLKNHIPATTENIIIYADSCRSQNRNIKVALLLKHFLLSTPTVKTIKQKFFVSGHSYNSCDRSFIYIDKKKKLQEVVATPDDWIDLISGSKKSKPYVVTQMETGDFFTSKCLEKRFSVNSKKSKKTENNFVWSSLREISQCQATPLHLVFSCENDSIKEIDLKERNMSEEDFNMTNLECLHPLGKAISKAKYMDLMQLKSHIPEKSWSFYENLRYDATIDKDYGLASETSDVEN